MFQVLEADCLPEKYTNQVRALDKNSRVKAPSNAELYRFITGAAPQQQLHDALEDCKVTAVGFLGGVSRGWWSLRPLRLPRASPPLYN